jgi:hypothetical protein
MTLTVRSATVTGATTKGSALTHAELDENFNHLSQASNHSFTPSGSGAQTEPVSTALQRLPHTAQYSSAANFNTARDALTGRFGMALLDLTGTGSVTTRPVLAIGDGTWRSSDQGIAVSRELTSGTGNAHGVDDNTEFSRDTYAYASFDAKALISGAVTIGHYAGFEQDATFTASTVNIIYGFVDLPTINGSAVDSRYGFRANDVTVTSGTLTNNYGVYVEELDAGGTLNYAIFTAGTTPSSFGGAVSITGTVTVGGGAATTPEVRVGNTSDGIALRGVSGEGRINGYDTGSVGFNPVAIYTGLTAGFYQSTSNNYGFGTKTFGTSAANVICIASGTAPTAAVADAVQFYSSDNSAGNTIPSFYCEGSEVIATGQADSASSVRVKMRINGTVVTLLAI